MSDIDFLVPKPDGTEITGCLRGTIEQARAAGGGRIIVPVGAWETGAIRLFDHIELHLQAGAILLAATDYEAYRDGEVSVMAENSNRALIVARDAENVSITGPGMIDGRGEAWCEDRMARGVKLALPQRPRIVAFEACSNVRISNLHVRNAPMWTIHLIDCQQILVRDCVIENDLFMPNTDGVNFDGCQDGVLRDCTIRAADDCVCLKTSAQDDPDRGMACERILVTGCKFSSNSCAVKIGTETYRDIRDAVIRNCAITESNRAFGIFSRDGGTIERILFEYCSVDCHWTPDGFWGNGEAVTINALPRRAGTPPGEVRDIIVRSISGIMESTINLVGSEDRPLKRIMLSEIDLQQTQGNPATLPELDLRPTQADLNEDRDPSVGIANAWKLDDQGRVIGLTPYPEGLPGLWAEHVAPLTLRSVAIARPDPLPERWNPQDITIGDGTQLEPDAGQIALPRLADPYATA